MEGFKAEGIVSNFNILLKTAHQCLEQLSKIVIPSHLLGTAHYQYLRALVCEQEGRSEAALAHVNLGLAKAIDAGCLFGEMLARALLALLHFQRGEDDAGDLQLKMAESLAERMRSGSLASLCAMTRARIAMERGDSGLLREHLQAGLAMTRNAGGPMFAWFGPRVMANLYAQALRLGIETDFVRDVIRRGGLSAPDADCERWPWPIKVYTLGRFSVLRDEIPICFSGKAQRKPLELLMSLLAMGGREVPASELADALWPDAEGDAAYRSLITNLQRLRQLLEKTDAIVLSGHHLSVNRELVWVDSWVFERLLNRSEQANRDGDLERAQDLCEKAMRHYHGSFLDQVAEPWVFNRRERLCAKYRHHILCHCQAMEAAGRESDAISCLLHALEADAQAEVFYTHLARIYRRLRREPDACAVEIRRAKLLG